MIIDFKVFYMYCIIQMKVSHKVKITKNNLRIFSRKEMDYLVIVKKVKNISIPYFRSSYGFSFSYLPR